MRSAKLLLPLLPLLPLLAACAGNAAPPPEEAVVLSVPSPAPTAVQLAEPEASPPPAVRPPPDIEACVSRLRDGAMCQGDRAHEAYTAALALDRAGERHPARMAYMGIIQREPGSACMPLLYLAFAEGFADEASSDPSKLDLARAAYAEVLKYPPPANAAWAYGSLRLAEMHLKQGTDEARALADFRKAYQATLSGPQDACTAQFGERAADGMVQAFAAAGKPAMAWSFFRNAGADRAWGMVLGLAAAYAQRRQAAEAAVVLSSALQGGSPDRDTCNRLRGLLQPLRAAHAPAAALADIDRLYKDKCP
jgi:hypothetical protein